MTAEIYHHPRGPSEHPRNLIVTMSGAASSSAMRLEDQLTEALAWLLDRDSKFALRFARRYVDRDEEAIAELNGVERLGVKTQIRLPPLRRYPPSPNAGVGHPRPDLSLTAPERRFQLLIEVKLSADSEIRAQVARYVESWEDKALTDTSLEAKVRRLGTLTKEDLSPHGDGRAADLRWKDIPELLTHNPEDEVAAVAHDLLAFIGEMYVEVDAPHGFLEAGTDLALKLAHDLADKVAEPKVRDGYFKPHPDTGYAGGYLYFTTPSDDRQRLQIAVTGRGSAYAEPFSTGAALCLYFTYEDGCSTPSDATRCALEEVGFRDMVVRAPYRFFGRKVMDLDAQSLTDDLDEVSAEAHSLALGFLSEAGLTTM